MVDFKPDNLMVKYEKAAPSRPMFMNKHTVLEHKVDRGKIKDIYIIDLGGFVDSKEENSTLVYTPDYAPIEKNFDKISN